MITVYKFHRTTGVYLSQILADEVNGELLLPPSCTTVAPPAFEPHVTVPVWNKVTESWELLEDHRRYLDETGTYVGGTQYWLPEDDYTSDGHYMSEPGPLPEGASLTRPSKPQEVIDKEQMLSQIAEAKSFLRETDYRIIKCAEQGLDLETEYPGLKAQRQAKRDLINQIEVSAEASGISLT